MKWNVKENEKESVRNKNQLEVMVMALRRIFLCSLNSCYNKNEHLLCCFNVDIFSAEETTYQLKNNKNS